MSIITKKEARQEIEFYLLRNNVDLYDKWKKNEITKDADIWKEIYKVIKQDPNYTGENIKLNDVIGALASSEADTGKNLEALEKDYRLKSLTKQNTIAPISSPKNFTSAEATETFRNILAFEVNEVTGGLGGSPHTISDIGTGLHSDSDSKASPGSSTNGAFEEVRKASWLENVKAFTGMTRDNVVNFMPGKEEVLTGPDNGYAGTADTVRNTARFLVKENGAIYLVVNSTGKLMSGELADDPNNLPVWIDVSDAASGISPRDMIIDDPEKVKSTYMYITLNRQIDSAMNRIYQAKAEDKSIDQKDIEIVTKANAALYANEMVTTGFSGFKTPQQITSDMNGFRYQFKTDDVSNGEYKSTLDDNPNVAKTVEAMNKAHGDPITFLNMIDKNWVRSNNPFDQRIKTLSKNSETQGYLGIINGGLFGSSDDKIRQESAEIALKGNAQDLVDHSLKLPSSVAEYSHSMGALERVDPAAFQKSKKHGSIRDLTKKISENEGLKLASLRVLAKTKGSSEQMFALRDPDDGSYKTVSGFKSYGEMDNLRAKVEKELGLKDEYLRYHERGMLESAVKYLPEHYGYVFSVGHLDVFDDQYDNYKRAKDNVLSQKMQEALNKVDADAKASGKEATYADLEAKYPSLAKYYDQFLKSGANAELAYNAQVFGTALANAENDNLPEYEKLKLKIGAAGYTAEDFVKVGRQTNSINFGNTSSEIRAEKMAIDTAKSNPENPMILVQVSSEEAEKISHDKVDGKNVNFPITENAKIAAKELIKAKGGNINITYIPVTFNPDRANAAVISEITGSNLLNKAGESAYTPPTYGQIRDAKLKQSTQELQVLANQNNKNEKLGQQAQNFTKRFAESDPTSMALYALISSAQKGGKPTIDAIKKAGEKGDNPYLNPLSNHTGYYNLSDLLLNKREEILKANNGKAIDMNNLSPEVKKILGNTLAELKNLYNNDSFMPKAFVNLGDNLANSEKFSVEFRDKFKDIQPSQLMAMLDPDNRFQMSDTQLAAAKSNQALNLAMNSVGQLKTGHDTNLAGTKTLDASKISAALSFNSPTIFFANLVADIAKNGEKSPAYNILKNLDPKHFGDFGKELLNKATNIKDKDGDINYAKIQEAYKIIAQQDEGLLSIAANKLSGNPAIQTLTVDSLSAISKSMQQIKESAELKLANGEISQKDFIDLNTKIEKVATLSGDPHVNSAKLQTAAMQVYSSANEKGVNVVATVELAVILATIGLYLTAPKPDGAIQQVVKINNQKTTPTPIVPPVEIATTPIVPPVEIVTTPIAQTPVLATPVFDAITPSVTPIAPPLVEVIGVGI